MAYRRNAVPVQRVCLVCHRYASIGPATCPTCPAPMAPIEESVGKLREMAAKVKYRPELVRYGLVGGSSFALALGAFVALLAWGYEPWPTHYAGRGIGGFYPLVAAWAFFFIVFHVIAQRLWGPPRTPDFDPLTAAPSELVRFLRLRIVDHSLAAAPHRDG